MKTNEDYIQNELGKKLPPKLKNMRYSKKGLPKAQKIVTGSGWTGIKVVAIVYVLSIIAGVVIRLYLDLPLDVWLLLGFATSIAVYPALFFVIRFVVQCLNIYFSDVPDDVYEDRKLDDSGMYGPGASSFGRGVSAFGEGVSSFGSSDGFGNRMKN